MSERAGCALCRSVRLFRGSTRERIACLGQVLAWAGGTVRWHRCRPQADTGRVWARPRAPCGQPARQQRPHRAACAGTRSADVAVRRRKSTIASQPHAALQLKCCVTPSGFGRCDETIYIKSNNYLPKRESATLFVLGLQFVRHSCVSTSYRTAQPRSGAVAAALRPLR